MLRKWLVLQICVRHSSLVRATLGHKGSLFANIQLSWLMHYKMWLRNVTQFFLPLIADRMIQNTKFVTVFCFSNIIWYGKFFRLTRRHLEEY